MYLKYILFLLSYFSAAVFFSTKADMKAFAKAVAAYIAHEMKNNNNKLIDQMCSTIKIP